MTKKVLSAMAAAAILGTGALAYEVSDLQHLSKRTNYEVNASKLTTSSYKDADVMIFPAFYAGNGFSTQVRVINNSNKAIVAKVVFFEKDTSKEVLDFNIYLSGNDAWTANIVEENGKYYLISTDNSSPLQSVNYDMASADNPLKIELGAHAGYFEILKAVIVDKSYHNKHKELRAAYNKWAKSVRTGQTSITDVDVDRIAEGVYQKVTIPHIDFNNLPATLKCFEMTQAGCFSNVDTTADTTLYGEETLINANSGVESAMTINPVYLSDSVDNAGLVYLEGEKANAMDIVLDKNTAGIGYLSNGDYTRLGIAAVNNVLVPYKDADSLVNTRLLVTSPFKRVLVQSFTDKNGNVKIGGKTFYTGVKKDAKGNITNYGVFKAKIDVYDNEENKFDTATFSPAPVSFMTFNKEVQSTEATDVTLSSYITKAITADQSFENGGYSILNFDKTQAGLLGIATLMTGTYVNGHGAINWMYPATDVR